VDGAEDTQEHFLREVERLVAIAEQVDRELDDHALVLADQIGKCGFVARRAPLDQCGLAAAQFRPPNGSRLLHRDHSIQFRPHASLKVPRVRPRW
jgi:hypothetical protein